MRSLIILSLLILCSCKEVTFKVPQPEGKRSLTTIPRNLQGKYLAVTEDGKPAEDTVIVTANGYRFGYADPSDKLKTEEFSKGTLGDSLILKQYKGYYFLNTNENPEWLLRVIRPEKNGDLTYMSMGRKDEDFKTFLEDLSQQIQIDSTTTDTETLYQISPTPNELIKFIEKGYFIETRLIKIK